MRLLDNAYSKFDEARGHALRMLPDLLHRVPGKSKTAHSLKIPARIQLDGHSCGAVAGFMALKYFDPGADFRGFYEVCKPCPENGVSTTNLVRTLRTFGVRVSIRRHKLTFNAVREALDADKVIIGCIPRGDCHHYWASPRVRFGLVVEHYFGRCRGIRQCATPRV